MKKYLFTISLFLVTITGHALTFSNAFSLKSIVMERAGDNHPSNNKILSKEGELIIPIDIDLETDCYIDLMDAAMGTGERALAIDTIHSILNPREINNPFGGRCFAYFDLYFFPNGDVYFSLDKKMTGAKLTKQMLSKGMQDYPSDSYAIISPTKIVIHKGILSYSYKNKLSSDQYKYLISKLKEHSRTIKKSVQKTTKPNAPKPYVKVKPGGIRMGKNALLVYVDEISFYNIGENCWEEITVEVYNEKNVMIYSNNIIFRKCINNSSFFDFLSVIPLFDIALSQMEKTKLRIKTVINILSDRMGTSVLHTKEVANTIFVSHDPFSDYIIEVVSE